MNADLVLRTLQISSRTWRKVLDDYARELSPPPAGETAEQEIARCLGALARAYRRHDPHAGPAPTEAAACPCPGCGEAEVRPFLVRRSLPDMRYGRCDACGHGVMLEEVAAPDDAAARRRHTGAGYYRQRDTGGAGYDGYGDEAAYREDKGARLVERLRALGKPELRSLLEVGSGFGYTRVAAERAGIRTAGVDVNPEAAAEAARRYGLATFTGTLDEALRAEVGGIVPGGHDAVLYQFVLEHVVDPARELAVAARALRDRGVLALLVPNMAAAEVDVFGASYRSFRADHRHLFTRASLAAVLARAGFRLAACESECNLHLFRDFLSPPALDTLYASGRGPDLFVVAEKLA